MTQKIGFRILTVMALTAFLGACATSKSVDQKIAESQAQTSKEDRIKFKVNKYDLDKSAQTALDEFAAKVKALNEQYYIEIQGHTDDTGGRKLNDELGERRADEVRRYLSR